MLTSFEQFRDWVNDNAIKRWVLYKDRSKTEKIVDSQYFAVSDQADKLAMTEKYLIMSGGSAFAAGSATNSANDLSITCDIRIQEQATSGINGGGFNQQTIGELRDEITRSVRAQIKAEQYEKDKAKFEADKEEFEKEKQSAVGALIHYFAPIGQQLLQNRMMRSVAGVDTEKPVHAAPIVVDQPEPEQPNQETEEEPFTDEESAKLLSLMVRFKAVEPRYLELIESVVEMAEKGDGMYNIAKSTLLKS